MDSLQLSWRENLYLLYPQIYIQFSILLLHAWASLVPQWPTNAEDMGLIPGLRRCPGERNGLGNPMTEENSGL